MKLYQYYLFFLRTLIDKKYLQKHENVTVLGERVIGRYYVVVFQVEKDGYITYHIIVENIKNPKVVNLSQVRNDDNYVVFRKHDLCRQLGLLNLYTYLVNNGLYKNIDAGLNKYNNQFSIHRLVFCIYLDIKNREIHHISKDIEARNDIVA